MYVNRCRPGVKGRVRQVYLRQYQNQHDQGQQVHQDEQTRRWYRPASHDTEGNTNFSRVKPHESATVYEDG